MKIEDLALNPVSQTRTEQLRDPEAFPCGVFCDFDGTITRIDLTDAVLEAFAAPGFREWETRWQNGAITSLECLTHQVGLLKTDPDSLIRFAAETPIDEGIHRLDQFCSEHRIPLTIVSDGIDLFISAVLERHGLSHLKVYANRFHWMPPEPPHLSFPYASEACRSGAGTCKCAVAALAHFRPAPAVYIGDGLSDRCVSQTIPTVFAKGTLKAWCARMGIPCIPFETLDDVADRLLTRRHTWISPPRCP